MAINNVEQYSNIFKPKTKNSVLGSSIADLFYLFLQNAPESYTPTVTLREFVNNYSSDENGMLSGISRLLGRSVSFDQIGSEMYSIDFLKKMDIHRVLQLPEIWSLGILIEQALISLFVGKFSAVLSGSAKVDFDATFPHPSIDTFPVLLSRLDDFQSTLVDEEEKKKFKSGMENFSISNQELKSELEKDPTLNLNIDGQEFQDWNPEIAKTFDVMTTKLVVDKTRDSVRKIEGFTHHIVGIFWKAPSVFASIFERYPMNIQGMLDEDPDLKEQSEALWYQKKDADAARAKELEKEIDELYWKAYIKKLKLQNITLGVIIEKLYQSDFDYSVLSPHEQDFLIQEVGNISLNRINWLPAWESFVDMMRIDTAKFNTFYQSIFDLNQEEIKIGHEMVSLKKRIVPGSNPSLKNLDAIENVDHLPLEFTLDLSFPWLSPEDRTALNILFAENLSADKKTATFRQDDLWKLLYLFFVGNGTTPLSHLDKWLQEKVTEFFDHQQKYLPKKSELEKWVENNSLLQFYDAWKKLAWYNFPEDSTGVNPNYGFKKGSSIWVSVWTSKLPPFEIGGEDYIQLKITDVDSDATKFKFRVHGGAIEFDNEKDEYELPMNKEIFDHRITQFDGNIIKFPDANEDFSSFFNKTKQSGVLDKKLFESMEWNWKYLVSKVVDEKWNSGGNKVEYLGSVDEVHDKNGKSRRQNIFYKLEYHPDNTITLSSEFDDLNWKRKAFKKRMSYDNFLLFVSSKKLRPRTKLDYDTSQKELIDLIPKKWRRRKWWGVDSISTAMKSLWKKLTGGLENYQKQQAENFEDFLVSDVGIWGMVGNMFGFIPSVKDAAMSMELEAFKKRDSRVFEGIKKWIWIFTEDPDFADFFEKKWTYMQKILGEGVSLLDFVVSWKTVVDSPGLRPIMAAALVAQLKAGKSLYRGMSGKVNQGVWVNLLFGPEHHARYMAHRKVLEEGMRNWGPDAKEIRDRLIRSEIDYILNNIRGSNGGTAMGSSKGDQTLKRLYSDAYTGELDGAYQSWTTSNEIETAYGKMGHNNFDVAYEDFKKIASWRVPSALAALQKMGDLARGENQKDLVRMSITYVLLSGALNHYGGKSQLKWFEALGRSFASFPPALLAQDYEHQGKVRYLLDQATNGSFSRDTKYKLENFDMHASNIPFKAFLGDFSTWWTQNSSTIKRFFDVDLINKDLSHDPLLQSIQDKIKDNSDVNTNSSWDQNDGLTTDSLFRISRTNIGQMFNYKNGRFQGKDEDAKKAQEDFRSGVNKSLSRIDSSPENVKAVMELFLKRFDDAGFSSSSHRDVVRKIKTIKGYKDRTQWWSFRSKLMGLDGKEFIDNHGKSSYTGNVHTSDVKDMMWYFFVGTVLDWRWQGSAPKILEDTLWTFKDFFYKNIDLISSDSFISQVFGLNYSKELPYLLVGRDDYNNVMSWSNFEFGDFGGDVNSKEEKKAKRAFYRETNIYINKDLEQLERRLKWKRIDSIPKLTWASEPITNTVISSSLWSMAA